MKPLCPTIGLYIHIPFCEQKCLYCDFTSFQGDCASQKDYLHALKKELALYQPLLERCLVGTLYIGGGTPTYLEDCLFNDLLETLRRTIFLAEDAEWTVEANPNSLDAQKIRILQRNGISRISLGAQSLQDEELQALGRIHNTEQFLKAYKQSGAGFSRSLDLMYGIPGQTVESFQDTLQRAVALSPEHLSCYSLILEPGTALWHQIQAQKTSLPSEEEVVAMYHLAASYLPSQGYAHYEIANFARPGHASRHNLGYWRRLPYLGLGLSAASFIGRRRFTNTSSFYTYLQALEQGQRPLQDAEQLDAQMIQEETIFLGLRTHSGVDLRHMEQDTGLPYLAARESLLEQLQAQGLLKRSGTRIRLTTQGFLLSNHVFAQLLL